MIGAALAGEPDFLLRGGEREGGRRRGDFRVWEKVGGLQLRDAGLVVGTKKGTNTYYRPVMDNLGALVRVIDPTCC